MFVDAYPTWIELMIPSLTRIMQELL